MHLQESIKPISYLKAHASEVIKEITVSRSPVIITQNGEATAILQDIASYEQTQESLALLKILALSTKELDAGQTTSSGQIFAQLRERAIARRNR